jgi:hypothetical protein
MPLEERLRMTFHRRFIDAVAPDIPLPPMKVQRPGGPPALRRAIVRARGALRRPDPADPWLLGGIWDRLPALRSQLEEALAHPNLREVMGDAWTVEVREGLRAGRRRPSELALAAGGLVADELSLRT